MSRVHFLNVLEGDCNIIEHDGQDARITMIDVSNAANDSETAIERAVQTSQMRQTMLNRTGVPSGKTDYRQKLQPDNPISYLKRLGVVEIFRFIISHPDMDHLDGIKDLFETIPIRCFWDTDNNKQINLSNFTGGYNPEDWKFYLDIRDGKYRSDVRRTFFSGNSWNYFQQDFLSILAPTPLLLSNANRILDYNDSSYVILYSPPKSGGSCWKILFCGDSHDDTWDHILQNHTAEVTDVDILIAPHHGRDSNRNYDFLKVVNPTITLFGNANSSHLAYQRYPEIRITNNQAGYVILDISLQEIFIYVKNKEFADDFRNNPKRRYGDAPYSSELKAYQIGSIKSRL